jgi:hypothetical protein
MAKKVTPSDERAVAFRWLSAVLEEAERELERFGLGADSWRAVTIDVRGPGRRRQRVRRRSCGGGGYPTAREPSVMTAAQGCAAPPPGFHRYRCGGCRYQYETLASPGSPAPDQCGLWVAVGGGHETVGRRPSGCERRPEASERGWGIGEAGRDDG